MDKNSLPPSMVQGDQPYYSSRSTHPPIGSSRAAAPIVRGPPVSFNRMNSPQTYQGAHPGLFTRGAPPMDLNRGPPPFGFNIPPPPFNVVPPTGAQIQERCFNPPVPEWPSVHPLYNSTLAGDNRGSLHHTPMATPNHNQPKRTFHGGEFASNDFTQHPLATSLPLNIPETFEDYAHSSAPASITGNLPDEHYLEDSNEDQPNSEENWRKDFEDRILSRKIKPDKKNQSLQISDIQEIMGNFEFLMQKLEDLKEEMRMNCTKADEHLWNHSQKEVEDLKDKLLKILNQFQDEKFISSVKYLISKRQKKRKRTKKQKERLRSKKEMLKKAQEKEEEKIDIWRERLEEQEKEKRREKALKLEADSILGEVRQKQTESTRMQKLLESLTTLRQARLNKGAPHGYMSTPTNDLQFSSTVKAINEVVASQMKEYELEEQTLRVMMGENVSRQEGNELSSVVSRQESMLSKLLFGDAAPLHAEVFKEYTAAEKSWEALLKRRFEWDQYTTERNMSLASTIPINWVIPPSNPSKEWAKYKT